MHREIILMSCAKIYWRKNKINLLLTNNEFMMGIDNKYFFAGRPPFPGTDDRNVSINAMIIANVPSVIYSNCRALINQRKY